MTIRVYTVSRGGIVTAPRPAVSVPADYVPPPESLGAKLPPCACPRHSAVRVAR